VKKIENRRKQETINEGGLKKKIKAEYSVSNLSNLMYENFLFIILP